MLRFVVAGLSKDRIAAAITRAGGDRVTVAVKTDIEGALALQTGQADVYVGACNSGAGGALAIATALLGAAQTVTLVDGSRAAAPAVIQAAVAAGKRAFGLRIDDIDRVVPELVVALLARTAE